MRTEELEPKSRSAQPVVPHTHPQKKSWPWLVAAFALCPCHIPILLAVVGTTASGAAVARNQTVLFVAMAAAFGVALWRYLATPREAESCRDCIERGAEH